ncbi:MAG: HYExAFE family protein, partial [Phycisphaerales bacterium]|nr:HYExAFE family protein [Phycisphaerales bacterium]
HGQRGHERRHPGRRESWATMDDVRSLSIWERLFGEPFEAVLVFLYWLDGPVMNAGETGLVRFEGRVYAHKAVRLTEYQREMRVRSPRWGTVDLPSEVFDRIGKTGPGLFETHTGPGSPINPLPGRARIGLEPAPARA